MSELTSHLLEETCVTYVSLVGDANVDAMMELFADGCTIEDPVGTAPRVGRDDVRALYATLPEMAVSATLAGPVCAVPDARSAAFALDIDTAGMIIRAIDVMTFDGDGRITSMTAYWRM